MTLYLDTSVLVAALTHEAETTRMQQWLRDQAVATLAVSEWVVAEFSSALALKMRSRQITATNRADALAEWEARLAEEAIAIEGRTKWRRGGESIYFRDPDGHLLELATPGLWPGF